MKECRALIFFLVICFNWSNIKARESESADKKFEWGGGLLSILGHHYRGSDEAKLWLFPAPYFTYKSEKIEADPSSIRGIFFRNEWLSFKLSLMAGLNVESKKNKAREGMPSLDYTIEAGPMFIFHLWTSKNKDLLVNFEWPIRESFATDLTFIKPVGLFTVPYLNFIHASTPSTKNWRFELSISPMYADQKYHDYFYGVDKQFERTDRPIYKAHGGYSGFQSAIILNKRIGKLVLIPFLRWDYLKGAVFMRSPLVKLEHYAVGGLGIFWIF